MNDTSKAIGSVIPFRSLTVADGTVYGRPPHKVGDTVRLGSVNVRVAECRGMEPSHVPGMQYSGCCLYDGVVIGEAEDEHTHLSETTARHLSNLGGKD